MDLAGNAQILPENPYGWIGFAVASPDGKRLAYVYNLQDSNVTLLEHFYEMVARQLQSASNLGISDDNRVYQIYPKRHTAQRCGHPYCYDTDL